MLERNKTNISRRTFITAAAGAVGGAVVASQWGNIMTKSFPHESQVTLTDITSYNTVSINPSSEINGGITNAPFIAYNANPSMVSRLVEDMTTLKSRFVRVFIPNQFEKPTGEYHFEYTTKLSNLLMQISELSGGQIKGIVCLDDLYNLLHSENFQPFYNQAPLDHHSLNHSSNPDDIKRCQKEFFTNPRYTDSYTRRVKKILDALSPVRHTIAALEAANEPEIPFDTTDKVAVLTEWYERIFTSIEEAGWDKPIVTGLANPALINTHQLLQHNFLHSAHIYLGDWSSEQRGLDAYIKAMMDDSSLPPIVLPESGFPRGMFGLRLPEGMHDMQLSRTLENLFLHNTRIDHKNKIAYFGVSAFGVWQLKTNKKSEDGFHFDTKNYPRTVASIRAINQLLTTQ